MEIVFLVGLNQRSPPQSSSGERVSFTADQARRAATNFGPAASSKNPWSLSTGNRSEV